MSLQIQNRHIVQTLRQMSIFVGIALLLVVLISALRVIYFREAVNEQNVATSILTEIDTQKILSQQIASTSLTVADAPDPSALAVARQTLQTALQTWSQAQSDLQTANPHLWLLVSNWQVMTDGLAHVAPNYAAIYVAATCILQDTAVTTADPACIPSLLAQASLIAGNLDDYLAGMAATATAFQTSTSQRFDLFEAANGIGLTIVIATALLVGYMLRWLATQIMRETQRLEKIEADLQASDGRFQVLAENSTDIILRNTPDGIHTYASPACRDILGYEPEELIGRPIFEIVSPEDTEETRNIMAKLAAESGMGTVRHHLRRKDGTYVLIETALRSIRNPQTGEILEIMGLARDITERQRAEDKIRRLVALQRAILDSANFIIISGNAEGVIQEFNASAERLTGYSADEMVGKQTVAAVRTPEDMAQRAKILEQLGPGIPHVSETVIIRKDGSRFPVELALAALRDENGVATGFVGIASDITERKMNEQRIRDSEMYYRSVIDALSEGVAVYDTNLRMQTWNRSAERILGLSLSDGPDGGHPLLGSEWSSIRGDGTPLPEEMYPALIALRTGEPQTNVVVGLSKLGQNDPIWLSINSVPLYHDGETQLYGVVTSFIDITELRRTNAELANARDRALEAARAKSSFSAMISHELRTPMNGIIGVIDLLLDTSLNNSQRTMVKVMRTSGQTLLAIINDTLDFSKIDAGRMVLEQREFEPSTIIENVVGLLAPEAHLKGLALQTSVDSAIPYTLMGDSIRLHQILLNLVGNAVKFTERGEVTVQVKLEGLDTEHATLRFSVQDTGIGISETTRKRIFAPFVQGDDSMTRKYGGTGLGLAICKRLVEIMDGEIDVQSVFGQGSIFWFRVTFPVTASDKTSNNKAIERSNGQSLGRKILIVEDNPVNQQVLAMQLRGLGYQAHIVSGGPEAITTLTTASYDLIFMDCQMPGMDGFETTQRIRHLEEGERANRVPIVAFTANAMPGDREQCLAAGMDDYIAKPIHQHELQEVLSRWLPDFTPDSSSARRKQSAPTIEQNAKNGVPTSESEKSDQGGTQPSIRNGELDRDGETPALDRAALADLSTLGKGNPAILVRLIDIFLENAPKSLAALRTALVQNDSGSLRLTAHSLKSTSASYGAMRLSVLCKALEAMAHTHDWSAISANIHQIETEYMEVKRMLEIIRTEGLS